MAREGRLGLPCKFPGNIDESGTEGRSVFHPSVDGHTVEETKLEIGVRDLAVCPLDQAFVVAYFYDVVVLELVMAEVGGVPHLIVDDGRSLTECRG